LVTGHQDVRACIILWRKCIDITDLLRVSQVGAAAGASARSGQAAEVDAEALAGMRLRTAGEVMQVMALLHRFHAWTTFFSKYLPTLPCPQEQDDLKAKRCRLNIL
jgi:hypothetical protein